MHPVREAVALMTLEQLREIARRATAGPWAYEITSSKGGDGFIVGGACDEHGNPISGEIKRDEECDDFIVDEVVRGPVIADGEGNRNAYGDGRYIGTFSPPVALALIGVAEAAQKQGHGVAKDGPDGCPGYSTANCVYCNALEALTSALEQSCPQN